MLIVVALILSNSARWWGEYGATQYVCSMAPKRHQDSMRSFCLMVSLHPEIRALRCFSFARIVSNWPSQFKVTER